MTKKTHTHKGHCQACGRLQAASNGASIIAKHGYRVSDFGYFTGTCPGSDRLALEINHTFLDEVVVEMDKESARYAVLAQAFTGRKIQPKTVTTRKYISAVYISRHAKKPGTGCYEEVAFELGTDQQKADAYIRAIQNCVQQINQHAHHAKFLRGLKSEIFGKALVPNKELAKSAPLAVSPGFGWTNEEGDKLTVGEYAGSFGMGGTAHYWIIGATGRRYHDSVQGIRNSVKRAKAAHDGPVRQ